MADAGDDNPYRAGSSASWTERPWRLIPVPSYLVPFWITGASALLMVAGLSMLHGCG